MTRTSKWMALAILVISLASCSIRYRHQVSSHPPGPQWHHSHDGFIRYNGYRDVAGDVETAVMTYEKKNSPVQVTLVGVIHIGDRDYYGKIQRILDSSDFVLYEMARIPKKSSQKLRKNYRQTAALLGLSRQSEVIDYKRKHFVRCDNRKRIPLVLAEVLPTVLRMVQIMTWGKARLSPIIGQRKLEDIIKHRYGLIIADIFIDPRSVVPRISALLQEISKWRNRFPNNRWLSELERDLKKIRRDLTSKKKRRKAIVRPVEAFVLNRLDKELKRLGKSPSRQTIAVFYGAAHMKALEDGLQKRGYRRKKVRWLKAWKIDSRR